MGKNKRKQRTEQLVSDTEKSLLESYAALSIQEYNFEQLIRKGVIVAVGSPAQPENV